MINNYFIILNNVIAKGERKVELDTLETSQKFNFLLPGNVKLLKCHGLRGNQEWRWYFLFCNKNKIRKKTCKSHLVCRASCCSIVVYFYIFAIIFHLLLFQLQWENRTHSACSLPEMPNPKAWLQTTNSYVLQWIWLSNLGPGRSGMSC